MSLGKDLFNAKDNLKKILTSIHNIHSHNYGAASKIAFNIAAYAIVRIMGITEYIVKIKQVQSR